MMRFTAAVLAAAFLALAAPATAVDPYEINVILPLTGNIAFVGQTELQALKALEAYVNRTGGIGGRPIAFVVADDQNDPKTSVLLTQNLIAKNVPVILGPSSPQSCAAVQPLIRSGPVMYCFAQAGSPPAGGYQFYTHPYDPTFSVTFRFFRERGWRRIAYIVSTDGGGQDAERTILAGAALPENKDVQLVAQEHFSPADLSVSAQLARIKAANPDVLIAWGTGTPAGTLFRAEHDAGIDLPTYTSTGNLVPSFFKQFGALLPDQRVFRDGAVLRRIVERPGDARSDRRHEFGNGNAGCQARHGQHRRLGSGDAGRLRVAQARHRRVRRAAARVHRQPARLGRGERTVRLSRRPAARLDRQQLADRALGSGA